MQGDTHFETMQTTNAAKTNVQRVCETWHSQIFRNISSIDDVLMKFDECFGEVLGR